jgi:quinol monooxygenase YgiN
MTVVVMAEAQGQTEAGYDGMLAALAEHVRQAPGFVLHSAYVVDGQWKVVEVWRTKAEADQFFARQVAPHLPPGVRPKRKVFEAHSLVVA